MTQDETCQIKSWKGNSDGSCKVFFSVLHFVDHQSAARRLLRSCLYISATSFWSCRCQTMKSCPVTKNLTPSGRDLFTAWVKMSEHEILVQHMVDIQRATADFPKHLKRNSTVPINTLRPVRLCRGDSASTTGTLDAVGEKKTPSKKQLQECGISLPCRKRPSMTTNSSSFPRDQLRRVRDSLQQGHLLLQYRRQILFTFMTRGSICLIK